MLCSTAASSVPCNHTSWLHVFPALNLISCCFVHRASKNTKPTANVASKSPCGATDPKSKLKAVKDREGGELVMSVARISQGPFHHSRGPFHHSDPPKNRAKWRKLLKSLPHSREWDLTKTKGRPVSDMEKLLMTWSEDQMQKHGSRSTVTIMAKAKFVCSVEW